MADQAINALSTKTAPETSDQLLLVGTGEPQLIDYDKLADAILNKITSKNYALDAGQMTLLAALNKLNSETSINLLPIKENGSFSAALKGKNYVMIAGYFYMPSDCPFSFSTGYYIAFRSSYLVDQNIYTIVGINTNGSIECKTVQLQ